jgi:FAD/FMN-containing dehydrogenase
MWQSPPLSDGLRQRKPTQEEIQMPRREAGAVDPDALRAVLDGDVVGPGEDGWDVARQAWNLHVDQRPAAVAYAAHADDVAAVVGFARERGAGVALQATGHGAAARGSLEDSILLRTERMSGVSVDAAERRARAEAGVPWREAAARAGEHGLAALHGSSPSVGVVGYTLGGGVGWLARLHGLASNSVTAIEVVTADGRELRVDGDSEPDLFWALRGGGGAFGAVTAIEFSLYAVAELYAGMLAWPAELGGEVAQAYREWARTVPDELTSVLRFLQLPPVPELPEPLRGQSLVDVSAAFVGEEDEGAELLRPLRELAPPVWHSFATIPVRQLGRLAMDPEQPVPASGDGMLVRELTEEAADAFVRAGGAGSGSPLISLQLRQLGGALAREPADAGALAALDADYAVYGVGAVMDERMERAVQDHLQVVRDAMAPHSSGASYMNFADQPGADTASSFPEAAWRRLCEVKARFDPEDLFRSNHPVPAAA